MISGVLFDLSGVLYVGDDAIPGAVEALKRLNAAGLPTRFVTNVTRTPARQLLARLQAMGFSITADKLFTAPIAARNYLRTHELRPYLLVHPALEEEFAGLSTTPPNAVLLGDAGDGFSYQHLNRAFRLLLEDGAPLLAMGNNRYFRAPDGLSLDIGPFVAALEYAADTRALIFGKPAPEFFEGAVVSLGCRATEVVMVGDDAVADVGGALAAGLKGILVKTGKYRSGDENRIDRSGAEVVQDITKAVQWILDQQ